MKLIFFGTGKFGLPSLKKLFVSGHEVAAVVTQPDRKRGRGWNMMPTAVKAFTEKASPGTIVIQPEKLDGSFCKEIAGFKADIFVVIDYGKLLSGAMLEVPHKYCVNLHPSLLPKYRGAAPVNWTVLNNESVTGNSVIKMTEKMDAGPVILQSKVNIDPEETAEELFERLSQNGAEVLISALESIENGTDAICEQDESLASYAPKLKKNDGILNWSSDTYGILSTIRAMQPWPGAYTRLGDKTLKIFRAERIASADAAVPGTVMDTEKFVVKTGDGALAVQEVQLEGKKRLSVEEFLRGVTIENGTVLG